MKKTKKKFDCVEMMHRGALAIYETTKNMTFEEQVGYWKERSEAFRKKIARAKQKKVVHS
ncbi:MAG: hypothetical protein WC975_15425 [Phycisphaerae bacterium]